MEKVDTNIFLYCAWTEGDEKFKDYTVHGDAANEKGPDGLKVSRLYIMCPTPEIKIEQLDNLIAGLTDQKKKAQDWIQKAKKLGRRSGEFGWTDSKKS